MGGQRSYGRQTFFKSSVRSTILRDSVYRVLVETYSKNMYLLSNPNTVQIIYIVMHIKMKPKKKKKKNIAHRQCMHFKVDEVRFKHQPNKGEDKWKHDLQANLGISLRKLAAKIYPIIMPLSYSLISPFFLSCFFRRISLSLIISIYLLNLRMHASKQDQQITNVIRSTFTMRSMFETLYQIQIS